jgi:hypothetical protein
MHGELEEGDAIAECLLAIAPAPIPASNTIAISSLKP